MKHILLTITLLPSLLLGQKIDHILGDIIVELRYGYTPYDVLAPNKAAQRSIDFNYKQLTDNELNIWLVHVDPNTTNEETFLEKIRNHPYVLAAQKNHLPQLRNTPNDEFFPLQWQYLNNGANGGVSNADLDMDLAWDVTTGGVTSDGDTIVVCVIDDGVNINHPDLHGNLWINHAEIPDNGIDDDNNGYIDDYRGWNAYDGNDTFTDGRHGTPVTGIIGARGNNMTGVSGINWRVKTMVVAGGTPESTAIASYAYAYAQRKRYNDTNGAEGAFVVVTNSSWGIDQGKAEDAPIWCNFYNKLGEVGILNCASTSNSSVDVDINGDLPAECSSDFLITVTNINKYDNKVSAGYGQKTIDLAAYGERVYTLTRNSYSAFSGTSAASPHVAGVIGLVYSVDCPAFIKATKKHPSQAALAVKDFILFGTTPNASVTGRTVTDGRLNAYNSIQNTLNFCQNECNDVYGLQVNDIGIFQASAQYLPNSTQSVIDIRYRAEGSSEWQYTTTSDTSVLLNQLEGCTSYEYESKIHCANDSSYSYTKRFITAGCCEAPQLLDVVVDNTDAIITWENTVGASAYIVNYKNINNSTWITKNLDSSATHFTIPSIQDCASIEYKIQTICAVTNRESGLTTGTITGTCGTCTEAYCPIKAKDTSDEWIESVAIDSVFTNVSGDDNGKGDFLGAFDIQLMRDKMYTLRLKPGFSTSGFAEIFSVYIDYNQNIAFDADELIYQSESVNTEVIDTFTVPASALKGTTRMRVLMRFVDPNKDGCDDETWAYGEYEDYCVNISNNTSVTNVSEQPISIYPTPSTDQLYIGNPANKSLQKIKFFNTAGNCVLTKRVNTNAPNIQVTQTDLLPKGVYFIQVHTNRTSTVHKWIKL